MEEQEKIRFHKFLVQKAYTCKLKEAARKVFLVEFDPDTQNWDDLQRANKLAKDVETYLKQKPTMYKALGFPGGGSKRETYFPQLLKEFSESPSEQERKRLEINSLNSDSQSLFSSNDQLGALLAAVKAGKKSQEIQVPGDLKMLTVCNLWEVLYKIRERNRLHGHSNSVYSVSFSPDGEMIASASKDGTVKLWHKDGILSTKTTAMQGGFIYSVCFSPKGKMIAFAGNDCTVKLWHLDDNEIQTFQGHLRPVYSVCFSPNGFNPNGQIIASASDDGTVKLWNLNGDLVQILGKKADSSVRSVSFSPDGKTLACGYDCTVKLWSIPYDGAEPKILEGHNRLINSVSFSPDRKTLASASTDGTVKLWNLSDGKVLPTFLKETLGVAVNSVRFSRNGKMIAWANSNGTVKLWNSKDLQAIENLGNNSLGKLIAYGNNGGTVKLENSEVLQTFQGDSKWINGISFSDDDKTIALACCDHTVKLWSLESIEVKTSKIWDIFDGEELRFPRKQSEQSSLHPDGQILASASHDGIVKLQNIQDNKVLHTFETNCSRVSSVSFSIDGKMLTVTSIDGREIKLNLNIEDLLKHSCNWLHDYLKTNHKISENDRLLCNEIDS